MTVYCSFCEKSQHEVRVLIHGRRDAFICDACVVLSMEIVENEDRRLQADVRENGT